MTIAIIGGSGLERFDGLTGLSRHTVDTPWGAPSAALTTGDLAGRPVVFLSRHGDTHALAPHAINYRANLHALRSAGATAVIAVATVGGIRDAFGPGTLVVPDQLIDYTSGRPSTFFEAPAPVVHVDFTHPYDPVLRDRLIRAAATLGEPLTAGATYGCTQGPRLETAHEIRRLERDGCDLVGMTGMPEAVLARELGLPYAAIAVVANHAAGKGDSRQAISLDAIAAVVDAAMIRVRRILAGVVAQDAV